MAHLTGRMQLSAAPRPFQRHVLAHKLAGRRACLVKATQQVETSTATSSTDNTDQAVPPGCSRYTVQLTKPMGLILEQDAKTMIITVAEILKTGSAARCKEITVGDQLIATSGVTYNRLDDYGGAEVRGGQQIVRLRVGGETMKTVSAAIGSHPGHIPVTLELQKCEK